MSHKMFIFIRTNEFIVTRDFMFIICIKEQHSITFKKKNTRLFVNLVKITSTSLDTEAQQLCKSLQGDPCVIF